MKTSKTVLELELDGHVYVVEKDKNGNLISKEEIDANLVLQSLIGCIKKGMSLIDKGIK